MHEKIVFSEPSVSHDAPLGWAEPNVNFYLKSTRPEAVTARHWINAAYSRFPDPTGRLGDLLRSSDNVQHASALDELFIHDQLIKHGRVIHEEGGIGPDFRIYKDAEYICAIEVCSLFENREWEAEGQRHARIADELNRGIRLGKWFIHFEVIRLDRQPSIRRLIVWINNEIAKLPEIAPGRSHTTEWITYSTDGAELRFQFVRRHSDSTPKEFDRVVGSGQAVGGLVTSYMRLRSALEKKVQKRYETRGKPFAIAVGVWDSWGTTDQFEDALIGNQEVVVESGKIRRANNGFFGRDRMRPAGKHTEISCIFALQGWRPWNPEEFTVLRFDNLFGATLFPDEILPEDYRLAVFRDERKLWLEWMPCRPHAG